MKILFTDTILRIGTVPSFSNNESLIMVTEQTLNKYTLSNLHLIKIESKYEIQDN